MPAIIIKDYTWRQTSDAVIIYMPIVGHPKKIDLFAIDNYMKASYPPFILELFLWGSIVEEESQCTIGEETAVFTLKKAEIEVEWPSLVSEDLDKDKKRAQRSRALDLARVSAEQRAKARSEKRQALQSQAVRAQIDLDTATLNKIEAMKDSHRKEAMKELEDWRKNAEKPILENVIGTIQENRKSYKAPIKWFKDEHQPAIQQSNTDLDIADTECKAAGVLKEQNENGTFKNTSKEQNNGKCQDIDHVSSSSSSDSSRSETSIPRSKSPRTHRPLKEKDENELRKSQDIDHVSSSNSSDSSSSDSETSVISCSKNPRTHRPLKEMDENELREYYLRKEKDNSKRGKDLVERVLSGKAGCVGRGKGIIFDAADVPTPRPRRSGIIDVKFSERHFPTPARESHQLEELEWLEKQAEARRKSGFVSEDLRPEEQDPMWLKDKGDEFFKAGNYLGAISAYTHGIKLSAKMSSLYVNRSAAHYAANNYRRCAEDCSTALELMVPKCEGNRDSRARCHARLGAALCKLSAPQHGIPELEAALKLAPENESIKRDLLVAKRYFEVKE